MSDSILLSSGYAAPAAFPGNELADIASDILRNRADVALQYGKREGYMPLREMIAGWLEQDKVSADPNEVMIITGAKQGLDIVSRAYCAPGDSILVSEPTYMNGLKIFRSIGLNVMAVPNDEFGVDVDATEKLLQKAERGECPKPKLMYEIPDFHNPTGVVMTQDRREKFVALAEKYDVPILEDNPYCRLRYSGSSALPLKYFDKNGYVISVGSFAKILGPGMRIGWIHAKRSILDRVAPLKADAGVSPLTQMMAHELFKPDGAFKAHLEKLKTIYVPKRQALLDALQAEFPKGSTWSRPEGGYYIWARVPEGINTSELASEAESAGVVYYRGSVFYASENAPENYMRLGFCYESPERIKKAISILGRIFCNAAQ